MGIPAYNSFITKHYLQIIQNIKSVLSIDNFFLDSNSIIYDVIKNIAPNSINDDIVIKHTIQKIDTYIKLLNPLQKIFISFDGVAPNAKINQQKTRRYKSWFTSKIDNSFISWDTAKITPGTHFMKQLSSNITNYYKNNSNVIVSTSEIEGEGEHKIFDYIKNNSNILQNQNNIIYGLDADLIMLGLMNLKHSPNIFLYKDTIHFSNILSKFDYICEDEHYFLNVNLLSSYIYADISECTEVDTIKQKKVTDDYVFLCFFLGNDFMPHFPHVNIRTNGIQILTNAYKTYIYEENKHFIENDEIQWKHIKDFCAKLAENEQNFFIHEIKQRNKLSSFVTPSIDNIPLLNRNNELLVNPEEDKWEKRYYKYICNISDETQIKNMCLNYCEGLEWTYKYYNFKDCPDWKWSYKYNYAPLFCDLQKYTPYLNTNLIHTTHKPIHPYTQLAYILPKNSLYLLPLHINQKLDPSWYSESCQFQWDFCKYFWEAHVEFPEVCIKKIEEKLIK
jgi:5'-3' exonuclease